MPRLRNRATGVVVNVSDETAALLGTDYEPADKPAPKTIAKKASSSKTEK
jgi:hypothetical protein